MDYETYVEHVKDDGTRLADAAADRLTEPVPSCPGWSVADLVSHVAEVYEHKIACTNLRRMPEPWPPDWAGRDPITWLADAHARLLRMFAESGPDTPSATWWPPDQTVGFWARRMAHETAVHRVDAGLAVGRSEPIGADLAVDGVDEILRLFLSGDWSEAPDARSRGQRVTVSTGGRRWTVVLEPESVAVSDGNGAADAAVDGDESDVVLWLWGRVGEERVRRSGAGDESV
jgi:uncharacterized protein (TIGR03083 family)